jgi:nitroreductase
MDAGVNGGTLSHPFDLNETDRLLTTTRAVRKRLDLARPVEPEVLLECIQIATQAPSGSNAQRWRWMIVTDAEKKKLVGGYYERSFKEYIAPKLELIGPDDHASVRMTDSATFLAEHMADVPALVIPCVLDRPPDTTQGESMAGFWGGVLPAIWSFQLALRSRGLGSAWTTLHLNFEKEVAEALGIPATVTQAALLPVAYYTGDDFKPAPRRPAAELTYWDEWKATRK